MSIFGEPRKPGKNEQPPCFRCNETGPNETNLLQPLNPQEPAPFVLPFVSKDACTGLNNQKLKPLSAFFTDPASYPNTTQSPIDSPTNFNLLYQSPPQIPPGGFMFNSFLTDQLNVLNPSVFVKTAALAISKNILSIVFDQVPDLPNNPTTLYVSLPSTTQLAQSVFFGSLNIENLSVTDPCLDSVPLASPALVNDSNGQIYAVFLNVPFNSCSRYVFNIALNP